MTGLAGHMSNWVLLAMVVGIPAFAGLRKVKVYDSFIYGAKDGMRITLRIIPHLIAMLVAIGMLRASGAFELLSAWLAPLLVKIGMPAEVFPLAILRPFTWNGASGVMLDLMHTHGGDSFIARLAATMAGSTETTFYVVAIYFGAVNIQRTRHAIPAGLIADLVGVIASVVVCTLMFGG